MSISTILNKNKEAIYSLLNEYKVEEARLKVLELLDCAELKNNSAVYKAKNAFQSCKYKQSLFLSTLVTYMTCIKVN